MPDANLQNNIERIIGALRVLLVPATPGEYDLHALVACALERAGIAYQHEARIAPGCRADFLALGVCIEIKKGKPVKSALVRQIQRYLCVKEVQALIVVTQRSTAFSKAAFHKPVRILCLDKLWGVALP